MRLVDYFPDFARELAAALSTSGNSALGEEFSGATIARVTHDSSCNACYIYLTPSRQLNIVETNVIGLRHGRTIPVEHPYWVYVDVDNFDRPAGIELLAASSIFVRRLTTFP